MSAKLKSCLVVLWIILLLSFGRKTSSAQILPEAKKPQVTHSSSNKIFIRLENRPSTLSLMSIVQNIPDGKFVGGITNTDVVVYEVSGDAHEAAVSASANSSVKEAFVVPKLKLLRVPNDAYFDKQWGLVNMKVAGGGETAWDKVVDLAKTADIKVAIIDTGVDRNHPDIAGKIANTDWIDCTGSGCIQSDFGTDTIKHGTHVAGIIGAVTDNSAGIAGVGWDVKLMSVKVFDDSGAADFDDVLNGIAWAAGHGARIINVSLGNIEDNLSSGVKNLIQQTVDDAWSKGAVIIAAAGNCGASDNSENEDCAIIDDQGNIVGYALNPKFYPAYSNNVLSVAALDRNFNRAVYSEYGNWVDVAAPGGHCTSPADAENCILSAYPEALITQPPAPTPPYKPYGYQSGTSMAAPHVSGVAALILATNPNLSNAQVVDIITSTANPSWGGTATNYGGVDALAAVSSAASSPTSGSSTPTPTPTIPGATNTPGPTLTPSSTPYPTTPPRLPKTPPDPYPSAPYCPDTSSCLKKEQGDANCDGLVDEEDYNLWSQSFDLLAPPEPVNQNPNFFCLEDYSFTHFIDMIDFEIWRRNSSSIGN